MSENFNQKRTKKSKKYATKKEVSFDIVTLHKTHTYAYIKEKQVCFALSDIFERCWACVRSDLMRTFLKTTRESDHVMKSLLSFFSRFWGSFSLFFFVSLSLFCVARARAVSLFLFFFRRRQRTRVEKKISAMLWTMMMKIRDF